jgi:hypothetical protein
MPNCIDFARVPSCSLLTTVALIMLSGWPGGASAQVAGGQAERPARSIRNILGGVAMSVADSARQEIVARLDLQSFKDLLRGLTEFEDREQGTPRNTAAVDWIEAQFRGWGYETGRVHYMFTPRESDTPAPLRNGKPGEPALAPADGSVRYVLGRRLPLGFQRGADHASRGREACRRPRSGHSSGTELTRVCGY